MNKQRKPSWYVLELLVLAIALLLLGQTRLRLTAGEHTLLLLLFVGGIYGLIGLWVYTNRAALDNEGREQEHARRMTETGNPWPTPTQRHFRQVMRTHIHRMPHKEHLP